MVTTKIKRFNKCILLIGLIGCFLAGCGADNAGNVINNSEDDMVSIVEDGYIYTLPLLMMDATRNEFEITTPANAWFHARKLCTSNFRSVVSPNVDTLYSQAFVELSEYDAIVVQKPESDRFMEIQVIDAWTDTVCFLGSGADGQGAATYLFTREDYTGDIPEGMTQVKLDTEFAWLLERTLVMGEDDLNNVYALQEGLKIMPLEYYISGEKWEPQANSEYKDFVPVDYVDSLNYDEFFARANELLINNPPRSADKDMVDRIAKAGIGAGLEFDSSAMGDTSWQDIKAEAYKLMQADLVNFKTANGVWSYFGEPGGEFGTEYKYRGMIAINALGMNPNAAAIYATAYQDSDGDNLDGNTSYVIHFEPNSFPPMQEYGFWSITAYTKDNFLIDNPIDKYAVNDRMNFEMNEDGSLDIYVSAEKPEDVPEVNWLPVCKDSFHLYFRLYLPDEDTRNGVWKAPSIKKVQ